MKRIAIVQARMRSTRLPGKVLEDVGGHPMLVRVIQRLKRCPEVDDVVVATTTDASDDVLVPLAESAGARTYRGSPDDVLARYVGAARESRADVVIRITADCPLMDPTVVSRVVAAVTTSPCDYASNVLARTFPRGLDVEAVHADVLTRIDRLANSRQAREHVTWFIYGERPDLFVLSSVIDTADNADLRWTVDTLDDLAMIRRLYTAIARGEVADDHRELIAYVRSRPELASMNRHIEQRSP